MLQKLSIAPKLGAVAQKTLRDIGLSAKVLPQMIAQDPQNVLSKLLEGFAKLAPEMRSVAMYSIFGRGPSKMVGKLVDNLDLYRKNLQYVSNPKNFAGSRDADYKIVEDTTASKLELLTNTISAFSRKVGYSLLPAIGSIADSITGVLRPIMVWMAGNEELTKTITTGTAGLIGFRIATFALGYASTFLFGGLNRLVIVFKGLQFGLALTSAAFRSFFKIGPLALIGIALLVYENWERIQSFFAGIWVAVEPHWNKFKLVLQDYAVVDKIMAAWTAVRDFFSTIWSAAAPHWNSFIDKIRELNIADKIMASWQKLKTFFTGICDDIAPKWDKFTSPLSKLWDGAKSSVSSVGSLFKTDEAKPSIASKLPPLSGAKAAPVTKNQNVTNNITVNASKISDPREVAKQVSKEMSGFNWNYLYDPVGAVP
jgi:hypothetical protein